MSAIFIVNNYVFCQYKNWYGRMAQLVQTTMQMPLNFNGNNGDRRLSEFFHLRLSWKIPIQNCFKLYAGKTLTSFMVCSVNRIFKDRL